MIVWINGPFGVGKSTVTALLAEQWPECTVFDPETLGFLLRLWQPAAVEVADFQDLSVWRRLVRETASGLLRDFGRSLLVPMTLLRPAYFDEIVGGLREEGIDVRHFCLLAGRDEVLARLAGRDDLDDSWAVAKFAEYEPWMRDGRFAIHVETSGRAPADVASEIAAATPLRRG